jgi:hypothetical protein
MQNMSFGPDGGLTEACRLKHPTEPHLCFMSPHMVDTIQVCLSAKRLHSFSILSYCMKFEGLP